MAQAKRLAGYLVNPATSPLPKPIAYRLRALLERVTYADCAQIHDLPPIFHYWSHKYIHPVLVEQGVDDIDGFFLKYLLLTLSNEATRHRRFASIGAGNCDLEVRLATAIRQRGFSNFSMICIDFNADALERGKTLALNAGLQDYVVFEQADFNTWRPRETLDCVIANQSLHHVEQLEHLFDAIKHNLRGDGWFVTSDMIGRNAHLRWPEAREIVEEYWARLAPTKKRNHITQRVDRAFVEINPAIANFEGVRAQDILPLLVRNFHFEFFFGFSNVIAPFVDRAYGPNFDPGDLSDRDFIDEIQARDLKEMMSGKIKPTQMLAAMSIVAQPCPTYVNNIGPSQSIRKL